MNAPEPLPEHVKAAQRRKIAKGLDGQSETKPDRDRLATGRPSSVATTEIAVQSVGYSDSPEIIELGALTVSRPKDNDLLVKLDQARRLRSEVRSIRETKEISDIADAALIYAKKAKLGTDLVLYASEIQIRAPLWSIRHGPAKSIAKHQRSTRKLMTA